MKVTPDAHIQFTDASSGGGYLFVSGYEDNL